ncbi:MAG TPA: diaminopimelate decarboxylase [Magnetospirillaceae bacterium]|jgi:diaminopimelate decarboxylase
MNHFAYKNGVLHAEDVPLPRIAQQVGTPFYCYSTATLERHYHVLKEGLAGLDATICYAVKANSNIAVIRTLAVLGAGADVVSEGELRRALAAGVPPSRIVFSGVGKTTEELKFAVAQGIMQINVESEAELDMLDAVARAQGRVMPIALRVNPDVDANTHHKITTGKSENKFGIEWTRAAEVLRRAQGMKGVEVMGLASHIGSQLLELDPFRAAFERLRGLVAELKSAGIPIRRLDLGGGLGVPYGNEGNHPPPPPAAYGAIVRDVLGNLGCSLVFEPGRLLVANAGLLVSRVVLVKQGEQRRFVVADAAMNDLVRPAMYEAYHDILPVAEPLPNTPRAPVDVVGPVCETGDTFARQRDLPPLAAADLIAFATAGAYGAAMSSQYNSRLLVPEVLVSGDRFAVIRARPSYDEMLALERLPDWQDPTATLLGARAGAD